MGRMSELAFELEVLADDRAAAAAEYEERLRIEKTLALQDQARAALEISQALMLHIGIDSTVPTRIANLANRLDDELDRLADMMGKLL